MARNSSTHYALIAPCVSMPKGGRESYTYHYDVQDINNTIQIGRVVRIPFGKRTITGVVLDPSIRRPPYPTKAIGTVLGDVLTDQQIEYARWIADAAHGGLGYTLRLFVS